MSKLLLNNKAGSNASGFIKRHKKNLESNRLDFQYMPTSNGSMHNERLEGKPH